MKTIYRWACGCALAAVLAVSLAWGGTTPASAANYTLQLNGGQQLNPGDSLLSPSGLFLLTMQSDGNLVLYSPGHIAIWASNTARHPGRFCRCRKMGTLLSTRPVTWRSGRRARPATPAPCCRCKMTRMLCSMRPAM